MSVKNSIRELHKTLLKASDKWDSYLDIYEELFAPLRDQEIELLEIGIQNGGSLELWGKFFPQHRLIIGCDIAPEVKNLRYEKITIEVVWGDANSSQTLKTILGSGHSFDIIIDDGSHRSDDVIRSFLMYFPYLKPGGIYVIEDTHCFYWPEWGGGITNNRSASTFFKTLTDVLNFEHWSGAYSIEELLHGFASLEELAPLKQGWLQKVEFVNSMIVVRKALTAGHSKLGERVISGTEAVVDKEPFEYRKPPRVVAQFFRSYE